MVVACNPFNLDTPHPSDDELIHNFQKNDVDFYKLIGMSNEDSKVIRIANDFTRLENNWAWPRPELELGFSQQRWGEYRSLFNKLGLKAGIERDPIENGTAIFLIASTKGLAVSGSSKGYVYSEKELKPVLDSLNDAKVKDYLEREKPQNEITLYRRIKGNWYIFHGR